MQVETGHRKIGTQSYLPAECGLRQRSGPTADCGPTPSVRWRTVIPLRAVEPAPIFWVKKVKLAVRR